SLSLSLGLPSCGLYLISRGERAAQRPFFYLSRASFLTRITALPLVRRPVVSTAAPPGTFPKANRGEDGASKGKRRVVRLARCLLALPPRRTAAPPLRACRRLLLLPHPGASPSLSLLSPETPLHTYSWT